MREGPTGPAEAAAELARLDELERLTKAFAKTGYARSDGFRGLTVLPCAITGALAGLLGAFDPPWGYLLLACEPVALLAGPLFLEERYLRVGRVEPFTYVPPPGPRLRRAGRIFATLAWLLSGVGLVLYPRVFLHFPGLPTGLALAVWGASFLAVGLLGWRATTSSRWLAGSIQFGVMLQLGTHYLRGDEPRAFALGFSIVLATAGILAVVDHLRFRKLERRLRALRERG